MREIRLIRRISSKLEKWSVLRKCWAIITTHMFVVLVYKLCLESVIFHVYCFNIKCNFTDSFFKFKWLQRHGRTYFIIQLKQTFALYWQITMYFKNSTIPVKSTRYVNFRSLVVKMIVVDKSRHILSPTTKAPHKNHIHKWKHLLNKHIDILNRQNRKQSHKNQTTQTY